MDTFSSAWPCSLASMTRAMCSRKPGQVLERLHRAHEFLEVVEPAGGFGRAVLLPHLGVAGFLQDQLGELLVGQRVDLGRPAREGGHQVAQCLPWLRLQLLRLDHHARRLHQRDAAAAGMVVQKLDRGVAEAALRHVDDALEGEIVGRLQRRAEIGERVADLGSLVEARAADDAVGQAESDEAVLELAHLEGGADEDGDVVEGVALTLQRLDLVADGARLLSRIPGAGDGDLLAVLIVGEERLAEPALVVGDEVGRRRQDMARRAVVALQPDDDGAGEILLEAQDVVDLGAAPAIDRLVVVADAAQVRLLAGRCLGEQAQPEILRDVGVLVLVDEHVTGSGGDNRRERRILRGRGGSPRGGGRRNRRR